MTKVAIRPYRAEDLDACRALWAELTERHRELYADPSIGGEAPGLYFDRHLALVGPERIWVADGGRVLGLVGLLVAGQDAEVEPIVVTAGERGQGIGGLLLRRAIEEARVLGIRYLSVRPVARNRQAVAWFYESGFRRLGQIDLFMDLRPGGAVHGQPGPTVCGCDFEC